jgi:hypothetical protein
MRDPVLQTVIFHLGVDVSDRTRRNSFTAHIPFVTDGNFTRMDALLQPGGVNVTGAFVNMSVPANGLFIQTAGPSIALSVTWTGPVTHIFNINQVLLFTDTMTTVTALQLVNNAAAGSPPVQTRIILF